jgi:hypothetical protein
MGKVTLSGQNNVTSPNGNSLALFVDGATGVMKVKDIMGNVQPLSDFIPAIKYGSFFSTVTQSAITINTPIAMTFNTEYFSSGVSVVSNSQITVDTDGIYNLQFSAQLDRISTSGVDKIDIWFRTQGVDVPNTNTSVTISGGANQAKLVASWNIYLQLTAGQYVELMYSVSDLQIKLLAQAENLLVPHPATPSVIVTIEKIN